MEKQLKSSNHPFILYKLASFLFIIIFFLSCIEEKMTLKEAKEVSISMSRISFVPPPRHVDDIIALLDQSKYQNPVIKEEMERICRSSPPENADDEVLANFYNKRSTAAIHLGLSNRSLEDTRSALTFADKAKIKNMAFITRAAKQETYFGNYMKAIELCERGKKEYPDSAVFYNELVDLYRGIGDLESAKKTGKDGKTFYDFYFNYSRQKQWHYFVKTCESETEANLLEINGKYIEAEPFRRSAIEDAIKYNSSFQGRMTIKQAGTPTSSLVVPTLRFRLVSNLLMQGRILEAELEARQALKDAVETFGKDSASAGVALAILGETLLEQNRLSGAETLIRKGISMLEDSGISPDSFILSNIRCFFGNILIAKYDFNGAMREYDLVKESMKENRYLYDKQVRRQPYIIVSLLKTGRIDEAMELISIIYDMNIQSYGKEHYLTAEIQGLRGMAYTIKDKKLEAIKDFSEAIPTLIKKSRNEETNFLKRQIFRLIIESYVELLAQIKGTRFEKEAGFDAEVEAFRFVDALVGKSVWMTLGASSARAAAADPELADLVRSEQDMLKQVRVLQDALANNLAMSADQKIQTIEVDLKNRIDALTGARSTILDEINVRFPKYADFVSPPPVTVNIVQKNLSRGEAFLSIYTSEEFTYIWNIPKEGELLFHKVPIGRKEMNRIVSNLRKALDPDPTTFGGIPEFDLFQAHDLYNRLLKPVEEGWKNTTDLIVIAQGPLGRLPLSVLPTSPVRIDPDRGELFENYRKVPWLIRKFTITHQPSISSFIALRDFYKDALNRKPFVGFGDPIYNPSQLVHETGEKYNPELLSRGKNRIIIRGIRKTKEGDLDSKNISSISLDKLNRLPDTADEIKSIADAIGADLSKDIFLGKLASEHQVKSMDLSDRRVIAFASHALLPGDLDGLDQPAIALSAPTVTGDYEDGLLTMGEILTLKLNSDWVVLSACNTGTADGHGNEALSGLGQAFFYAGTRAILASMWPVETTSANNLTTRLFRYQKEEKGISKSKAHQNSMLDLIDNISLKDNVTGKVIVSYSHPIFWAPFILIGDGG